ncbi:MAG: dihydropteroate synthase [Firmicutes bacterium]|nr:dihydropteroate synthase [Bacillota bacterium]
MTQQLRLRNNRVITFERMEMMGIVNVTPDSFYAGSRTMGQDGLEDAWETACAKAGQHIAEGARMIDVGGESTRPGSAPVSEDEEISRICPVIERIRTEYPDIILSADTYRAGTASAALQAGADLINDISGLTFEPALADAVCDAGAGIILMHTGGRPDTMQDAPFYENVVEEVYDFLHRQMAFAVARGIGWDQIMIDMGIGFGKTREHNLQLLRSIDRFSDLGCPHLLAVSRKSFIGSTLGREDPEDRLAGTLAVTAFAAEHGIAAARVHDVKENLDAARMAEELTGGIG